MRVLYGGEGVGGINKCVPLVLKNMLHGYGKRVTVLYGHDIQKINDELNQRIAFLKAGDLLKHGADSEPEFIQDPEKNIHRAGDYCDYLILANLPEKEAELYFSHSSEMIPVPMESITEEDGITEIARALIHFEFQLEGCYY